VLEQAIAGAASLELHSQSLVDEDADALSAVVGQSAAMQEVKATLRSLSRYSINLLLTGPTGTGKSFLSRLYHSLGPRAARPFVEVPCPNIPATLFESELFGHARGAFTDARSERRGLIVEAHGGTVFLDEITEISARVQAKLLYVSESRQVRPVGSSTPVEVNVQFVSATNRNLAQLVAQGRFRRDLYYRLSGIEVALPPLRDRGDDVLLLAERFVREFAATYRKEVRGWDASTESWMLAYAWPGNVRELRETLRVGLLRARTALIHRGDLRVWAAAEDEGPADLRADTVLRRHLKRVLELAHGNLTRAGALLGWERNKVRREARRLGVPLPRNAQAPEAEDDDDDDEIEPSAECEDSHPLPGEQNGNAERQMRATFPAFGDVTATMSEPGAAAARQVNAEAMAVPEDGAEPEATSEPSPPSGIGEKAV
jgi:two-component system response regulator HydG